MISFAWWSLVVVGLLGLVTRVVVLAYAKTKTPGSNLVGLLLETWTVVALIVWLRP